MKQYIICVGDKDFIKNSWHETTTNSIYAMRFDSLEHAQQIAAVVAENSKRLTLVREFSICNSQEILEAVQDNLETLLKDWAADIDTNWNTNTLSIFDPDGRKTYKLKLETVYAD